MKSIIIYVLTGSLVALFISCGSTETLFRANGTSWFEKGQAQWKFAGDEIVGTAQGGAGFIMTKERFGDFVLKLEFYPDETVNSGIFIRCKNDELSYTDCYEINIWDNHPDQKNRTGAIVSRAVPMAQVQTLNKWNTYKIKSEKNHIQAWVNGILTADIKNEDLTQGYIGLQAAEIGTIKFRKVRIKRL
ncbi:MAG: DUF1080 domain-containing protein [Maribacter sp.]|nr:DUF1080 domain-containing protein [Maribacter sp.]